MSIKESFEEAAAMVRLFGAVLNSRFKGREVFDASLNTSLPSHIEHMYPDYSLYPQIQDTAYGYLSRGCPRGCDFCIVKYKEGLQSQRVAHLREFWSGEKNIVIMDPNILACRDREELLEELIASKSWVDINQGLDARLLTEDLCKLLSRLKMKEVHFAWDRYQDKEILLENLKLFKAYNRKFFSGHHAVVYTIVNYDTTIDEDLDRIYTLLGMGYSPYVMIYNKQGADSKYRNLQRWCNSRQILSKCNNFSDYLKSL